MTRPIVWALAVTAVAGGWASGVVGKLDQTRIDQTRIDRTGPTSGVAVTPSVARGAPDAAASGPNTMTLFADQQGHFTTDAVIDGRRLRMLVDTGATSCAFTYEDAQRMGLNVADRDFRHPVQTANGVIHAAFVRIPSMRVGSITVQAVEGMVMPRGRLSTSLLGMSFLRRLTEFSMNGARLTLRG